MQMDSGNSNPHITDVDVALEAKKDQNGSSWRRSFFTHVILDVDYDSGGNAKESSI